MIGKFSRLATAGVALAVSLSAPAYAGRVDCHAVMAHLNPDHDGTIDWREARRAAKHLFFALDPDRDGTLDRKELQGRVGLIGFLRFNLDRDRTLDLGESLNLVKFRFDRANPDKDGTIDCRELNTLAGRDLLKVLM